MTASDGDYGRWGELEYGISGDGVNGSDYSAFSINPSTGTILLLNVSSFS